MVVEITAGVVGVVFLRQHGGYQFLRCRLTVCASHADDTDAQLAAVVVGKLLQSGQHIINQDITVVRTSIFSIVNHSIRTTFIQCGTGVCVTVECLAFQSEKQRTCRAVTAVSCHNRMLLENFI